jgi:hypothetical protein
MTVHSINLRCLAVLATAAFVWLLEPPRIRAGETPDFSDKRLQRLEVFPTSIRLDSARSDCQLVVTGIYSEGARRDLSRAAACQIRDKQVAKLIGTRVIAVGNGKTSISVSFGEETLSIPVKVAHADAPDPIRFEFETLAAITKQGCNAGSCHGSPHGKGGFSLSLFAYDPEIDKVSLVRGRRSRRVNTLVPEESLLLKKPMLRVTHVGGKRIRRDDVAYSILRQWIYEGASVSRSAEYRCTEIAVTPSVSRILYAPDRQQQLNVTARFSDGTIRDVTRIATFGSSDKQVATVDANGLISCHEKGQAAITIRYLNHLKSVYITHVKNEPKFVWREAAANNEIDRVVNARLKLLQYQPSPVCSDSVFLRRVYLDLTGLLPESNVAKLFLEDASKDKRSKLIDQLLDSEEFVYFQALQIADLLRVNSKILGDHRAKLFADWIAESIKNSKPYDQFARDLLTASGDSNKVGPANYFAAMPATEEVSEATAQIFFGSRIQCAKCHNHPFENWTQNDYYRIGAVFHRLNRKDSMINVEAAGELMHPKTGKAMQPWGLKALTPANLPDTSNDDRRVAFADWLTRNDNPFFAHVAVNRIWSHLFGSGIVNPIDDFRSSNPPSNVALIDFLADELRENGFDRKHIIKLICNSTTYQRSTATNASNVLDAHLFSRARPRMLSAEQLQDAIGYVTGTLASARDISKSKDPASKRYDYATQRPYPEQTTFLKAFGQPARTSPCACDRSDEPTLEQAIELLNGNTIFKRIRDGLPKYQKMDNDELVESLYLTAYSRRPRQSERQNVLDYFAKAENRDQAVGDLVWAIISTQEFLFQH